MKKFAGKLISVFAILALCAYPATKALADRQDPTVYVFSGLESVANASEVIFQGNAPVTGNTRRLTAKCGALTIYNNTPGTVLYVNANPTPGLAIAATYTDQIVLDDDHPTYEFGAFMPSKLQAISDATSDLVYTCLCYGSNVP
jgi:hypothetical protein